MSEHLERRKIQNHGETRWCVIGARGAVDFHCMDEPGPFGRIGGVEHHMRTAPDYYEGKPADHTDCWLLGGPCWHDGTSLYATEFMIPLLEREGEDALWLQLEREYDKLPKQSEDADD